MQKWGCGLREIESRDQQHDTKLNFPLQGNLEISLASIDLYYFCLFVLQVTASRLITDDLTEAVEYLFPTLDFIMFRFSKASKLDEISRYQFNVQLLKIWN